MPHFILTVAASADGFISRGTDEPPQAWASAEEQALFFRDVGAADWAIMGRYTHNAADRPDRHRIVFSSSTSGWRRPTQLWLDPEALTPSDLPERVAHVRPLESGLILGGQRVHDWFLAHAAIDEVHLTVEPIRFGSGIPIFGGQATTDPVESFRQRGFVVTDERLLNAGGTRYLELVPGHF